jgi:transcriptional regulator
MDKQPVKFVLLSDVVGSRNITDRRKFEKKLSATLQKVQQQYEGVFEVPVQVWKGLDETAAIIKAPWQLYDVMDAIDEGLHPHYMRFVLVKGSVDVLPKNGDVSKADGEAFHKAAELMVSLKQSGLKFSCTTQQPATDMAWQAQVNLLWLVKQRWTDRQRNIYRLYNQTGLQEAVAKQLKIVQQTVSKTLKSISAAEVQQLENMLRTWAEMQLKK